MIQSPLNYTGGKSKLLDQILPLFPSKIDTFVDLFCGGCNVGLNTNANSILYNDLNTEIINLFNVFLKYSKEEIFDDVYDIINEYGLSLVSKYGYDFYNCNSSDGLGKYNRNGFNQLRSDYNKNSKNDKACIMLYVLIVYAFNNQIRFNSKGEYNLPVGKRDFNKKMEDKLYNFKKRIDNQSCTFTCRDFRKFDYSNLSKNDLVYVDPPYLIACASYNENGGWSKKDEVDLLNFLDRLSKNNIKFALSNVLESKGKKNNILIDWLCMNKNYKANHLDFNYSNSNYHTKNKNNICDEVLIVNY